MKKLQNAKTLIDISHKVGKKISYIQGGGGNTSIKINKSLMAIKASGTNLKDMGINKGQTLVDFKRINNFLDGPEISEEDFSAKINSISADKSQRPSIETGFHSLLGKFVIHTHSVYVNVLLCSEEGKKIINELFPKSLWVDYFSPGKNLTLAVKDELKKSKKNKNKENIVFLQNHGLIVSSETGLRSLEIHEQVNKKVRDHLKLKDFKVKSSVEISAQEVLFPDQIVYLDEETKTFSTAAKETLSAYSYIKQEIKSLNLSPNYLAIKDVLKIKNMESEKYRKSLVN